MGLLHYYINVYVKAKHSVDLVNQIIGKVTQFLRVLKRVTKS